MTMTHATNEPDLHHRPNIAQGERATIRAKTAHGQYGLSRGFAEQRVDAAICLRDASAEALLMDAANAHDRLDLMEIVRDFEEAREQVQVGRDTIDAMNGYLRTQVDARDPLHAAIATCKERLEIRLAESELRLTEMSCLE